MWQLFLAFAVVLVASIALAPKPQSRPRPEFDDIQAPTAEDGRELPVLFGCREIKGPNVVWYGDLLTIPIKSSGGKK